MFNPKFYENSLGDGFPVMQAEVDNVNIFVPLKKTELAGDVHGPLAKFTLTQIFSYSKSQLDKIIEAKYRFPLPGDAAILGVTISFGDVEIAAQLKQKEKAKQEYEQAKTEGKQAVMTVRESIDVFTLNVAGIKPDEDVKVQTTYVQMARPDFENWTLRVPLTTVPRFCSKATQNSKGGDEQPLSVMRDPQHRFTAKISMFGAAEISSSSHTLKTEAGKKKTVVTLSEGEVIANRDFVLNWQAERKNQTALQVFTHDESEYTYFMALVTPPGNKAQRNIVSRESVILLDHSGSMEGSKSEAGMYTVRQFLNRMNPRDTFSFGLFHLNPVWHNKQMLPATREAVDSVDAFLANPGGMGGTMFEPAMREALEIAKADEDRSRHLVIITDGQISGSDEINCLKMALAESASKSPRRISIICIDSSPNSQLVNNIVEAGKGEARFLNSDANEADISSTLENILTGWEDPVVTNLSLDFGRSGVQAIGRQAHDNIVDLGDLSAGRPIWVCGRVPKEGGREIKLRKDNAVQSVSVKEYNFCPAVKALFGARRIQELEFISTFEEAKKNAALKKMGYDPSDVKDFKELLANESIAFGVPSSETSFVAVRKDSNAKIEGGVEVPNALAHGWNAGFTGGMSGYSGCSGFSGSLGVAGMAQSQTIYTQPQFYSPLHTAGNWNVGSYPSAKGLVSPQHTLPGGRNKTSAGTTRGAGGMSAGFSLCSEMSDSNDVDYWTKTSMQLNSSGGGSTCSAGPLGDANLVDDSQQKQLFFGFRDCFQTKDSANDGYVCRISDVFEARPIEPLFKGIPKDGEVLFDSSTGAKFTLPFKNISIQLGDDDEGIEKAYVLLYVGDMNVPKARIRLKDFVRYSKRPLSLLCTENDVVKITMVGTINVEMRLFLL